jgi:hypothetical protein
MHNTSINLTRISRVRLMALVIARAGYANRSAQENYRIAYAPPDEILSLIG